MPEQPQQPRSRPQCGHCQRPVSHCLCPYITAVFHRTRVVVLQHPAESRHPLNTARLAVLGLQNAELSVGECFSDLETMIAAVTSPVLLFPSDHATIKKPVITNESENNPPCEPGQHDLLIVPDGTWRKARGIIRANPVLNTLPRLDLPAIRASRYRVRKARETGALSTIEAIVCALTVLEPEQDFEPVLQPFDVLVEQQIQAMGRDVYERHHMTG